MHVASGTTDTRTRIYHRAEDKHCNSGRPPIYEKCCLMQVRPQPIPAVVKAYPIFGIAKYVNGERLLVMVSPTPANGAAIPVLNLFELVQHVILFPLSGWVHRVTRCDGVLRDLLRQVRHVRFLRGCHAFTQSILLEAVVFRRWAKTQNRKCGMKVLSKPRFTTSLGVVFLMRSPSRDADLSSPMSCNTSSST